MDLRKIKFHNTFNKRYFNSIFNLDYRKIEAWIPRDYPNESIKEFYKLNYLLNSRIKLKHEKKNIYNLSKIKKYNIFYDLYFGLSKERDYNDYFFNFILNVGDKPLLTISNRGSDIIDFNKKKYEDDYFIYYPICLFECLEYKFLCTDDFDEPIYIVIQYINNKVKNKSEEIRIKDTALIVNCTHVTSIIHKKSEFYFNEIQHLYSKGQSFIPANKMRINDEYIFIDTNQLCYTIHMGFWDDNYNPLKIKSIDVHFDDYHIPWSSSKIIENNNDNIHVIEFFPDTDNDFIKKNNVYGINMHNIGTLALIVHFYDSNIELKDCKIFIGIGTINYLELKPNKSK